MAGVTQPHFSQRYLSFFYQDKLIPTLNSQNNYFCQSEMNSQCDELNEIKKASPQFDFLQATSDMISFTIQAALSFIYLELMDTIAIHFISQYASTIQLAGYGFAIAIANIIMAPFFHGCNYALNVQAAQAIGQQKPELALTFLNFTFYTHIYVTIPLFVLLYICKEPIGLFLVEDRQETINYAWEFLPLLVVAGTLTVIFDSFKSYLMAHTIVYPFKYVSLAQFSILIIACWYFLGQLELGIFGVGVAFVLSEFASILLLILFSMKEDIHSKFLGLSFKPHFILQFRTYCAYMVTITPIIVHMYLEIVIYLLLNLIGARLGTLQFSAQLVLMNISGLYFKIPLALSMALQTYVGQSMGSNIGHAINYTRIGCGLMLGFQLCLNPIVWFFKNSIIGFYIKDEKVHEIILHVLPYFLFWTLASEGAQEVLAGVLKGIEEAQFVTNSTFILFYVFGVPTIIYMTFFYGFEVQVKGIWIGFAITTTILALILAYKIAQTDWVRQGEKIKAKMIEFENQQNIENEQIAGEEILEPQAEK